MYEWMNEYENTSYTWNHNVVYQLYLNKKKKKKALQL